MGKLSVYFVAIALTVILDEGLAGYTGRYKNWKQFDGNVGVGSDKCTSLSGILPDPQSGCCGKHAGSEAGGDNNDQERGDGDIYYDTGAVSDGNGDQDKDWGNGIDDDDVGGIFDDIDIGRWFNGFRGKRSAEQNDSDTAPDKYITAGKPAGLRQYPWLVRLVTKIIEGFQTMSVGCGGSLISPRFVLTAAHCVDVNYQSYNDISIILAEYDTRTFPRDCVGSSCVKNIVMNPDKVIKHRGYDRTHLHNDIALMRLRGSAPYTEYIRPVCLPTFNVDNANNEGKTLLIAGWGNIGTGREASPIKLTAQVELVSHQRCRRSYSDLIKGQICASGRGGQDTCQGDSGGPLMVEHEGSHYVVGIVSGKSADYRCGSSFPTLYTNVFAYTKWIQQQMGSQ